ncbi:MAG: cupin domain-containing protein [Alphaproteobacteria bacterium]|nr:cupin domain-containing protein [Alphaproteobacteria bacterium]
MRSEAPDVIAPDGSEVRILAHTVRGSMAEFSLPAGQVSIAVAHHTVEEVWFFTQGQGQMWRKMNEAETVIDIRPGLSISIPVGAHFQFRNTGTGVLRAIGTTMPPWPGMDEAYAVLGKW